MRESEQFHRLDARGERIGAMLTFLMSTTGIFTAGLGIYEITKGDLVGGITLLAAGDTLATGTIMHGIGELQEANSIQAIADRRAKQIQELISV
ncbi:MAG TPA: hypothetical protein VMR34_02785 [Candidatus Saccharimonadales bacterium]|jgi:TRAP-type C4-dicarboxylate transport system permease large subunit|nr:hypothetical protein [Candidatus Saccharimonadales bacterium]